jgi:glycosyltransferase involved in cell wall biosynthesis
MTVEKITYITDFPMPSYAANTVGIMNQCAAFASAGIDTHLTAAKTPWIRIKNSGDLYEYYGVERNFKISRFLIGPHRTGIRFSFDRKALKIYKDRGGTLYTRNLDPAFGGVKDITIIYELHHPPTKPMPREILQSEKILRIVCISKRLADWTIENFGSGLAKKIIVAPDAVNIKLFENKNDSAEKYVKFRVGYTGALYNGRGIEIIIALAEKFSSAEFIIAGGRPKEISYWKKQIKSENIKFVGYIPPAQVPQLLNSFDCLLMPYQKNCALINNKVCTAEFASPLKMFEYMASGRPIISSDLPVLQEILEAGKDALIVASDDVYQWTIALNELAREPGLGKRLAQNALEKVKNYTWEKRAAKILEAL